MKIFKQVWQTTLRKSVVTLTTVNYTSSGRSLHPLHRQGSKFWIPSTETPNSCTFDTLSTSNLSKLAKLPPNSTFQCPLSNFLFFFLLRLSSDPKNSREWKPTKYHFQIIKFKHCHEGFWYYLKKETATKKLLTNVIHLTGGGGPQWGVYICTLGGEKYKSGPFLKNAFFQSLRVKNDKIEGSP